MTDEYDDMWIDAFPQGRRFHVQQNAATGRYRYRQIVDPLGNRTTGEWMPGDPYGSEPPTQKT